MPTNPLCRMTVGTASLAIVFFGASTQADELRFGDDFWKAWGDGQAELASYQLEYPRYGEVRAGTAVTIFVTETFSSEDRVKADPGRHAKSDEFPVMKLNLVQDFPTGLYDYNMMTSSFASLTHWNERPPGSAAKVTFSSQEWCGHVFHQVVPGTDLVQESLHSYFDGEADREGSLAYPQNAVFEDLLFHWARGFASPRLAPGESREVPLLRSVEIARLRHVPLAWDEATLTRDERTRPIESPAGTIRCESLRCEVQGRDTWTFWVEADPPHRIVRWEREDGLRAKLVASERLKYWQMNGDGFEGELQRIGLKARPARTP